VDTTHPHGMHPVVVPFVARLSIRKIFAQTRESQAED